MTKNQEFAEMHRQMKAWMERQKLDPMGEVAWFADRVLCSLWYCAKNPPDEIGLQGLAQDTAALARALKAASGTQ